jgi:hypothetical protein
MLPLQRQSKKLLREFDCEEGYMVSACNGFKLAGPFVLKDYQKRRVEP